MSTSLQSGQHLDPNQVSAFIDHAMAESERSQTVIHLAECRRCRQIVLLVQDADAQEAGLPGLTPESSRKPAPAWRRWFTLNPLLAMASAAFASVLITSTTFVTQRHLSHPSTRQIARLESPAPLHPPVPQPTPSQPSPTPAPPPATPTKPQPPATATEIADAASALHLDNSDAADNLNIEGGEDPEDLTQPRPKQWHPLPLPSKLPAIAVVSKVHIKLAADIHGNLYQSPNGGGHWRYIKPLWQGRVDHLDVTSGPPIRLDPWFVQDPGVPAPIPGEARSTFELLTDAGELWTSLDGIHWRHRPVF